MIEFEGWPKTPRLSNSGAIITEKIDGTNACVVVQNYEAEQGDEKAVADGRAFLARNGWIVYAQSRKRLITPTDDNAGFARWVWENAPVLVDLLGPGRHFGEWWGQGIQRRYGMDHKVFSLFNWHKWSKIANQREDWTERAENIHMAVVPMLYIGKFSDVVIEGALRLLREKGSFAAAQWGKPNQPAEGVIIRHRDLGGNLKAFVENDDVPKGLQNTVNGDVSGKLIQAGDIVGNISL